MDCTRSDIPPRAERRGDGGHCALGGAETASVDHWFASRAATVSAIAERTVAPATALLSVLAHERTPAVEQLYRYLRLAALTLLVASFIERPLHHDLVRLAAPESRRYRNSLATVKQAVRSLIEQALAEEDGRRATRT